MSNPWQEPKVESLEVSRDGDGSINHAEVTARRSQRRSAGTVTYTFRFKNDGGLAVLASVKEIRRDDSKVLTHHFAPLWKAAVSAVQSVPEIDATEPFGDTLTRQYRSDGEAEPEYGTGQIIEQ